MKKQILFTILMVLPFVASAHDIEVDGIYYNYTSINGQISVTYQGSQYDSYNEYIGIVNIPETVVYNDITYKVRSISESAFRNCSGLTAITIPNSVTFISKDAFNGCSGLTSITIPTNLTSISSSSFKGCNSLASINIPDNVTYIASSAFSGCSGLTSVSIPNSVTDISYDAFEGCVNLTTIIVDNYKLVQNWKNSESSLKKIFGGQVTSCVLGNNVKIIGEHAFSNFSNLTSIIIPNSVTSIGESAFEGCSGLTSITIPNSVTSIGWSSFKGCSGLTSINIPDSVTSIGQGAFEGCISLASINIPDNVTYIASSAFSGCSGLTSVSILNSVTSIGANAFKDCSGLTSINIPDSVTSIGQGAFEGCISLASITIPNSVTSIGWSSFKGCSGLTSINIPNSVSSIGKDAFKGCSSLTTVTLDNNTIVSTSRSSKSSFNDIFGSQVATYILCDNVTKIGEFAFYSCSGLTSVTIPNSVTSIGANAFQYCSGLTSVTIPNSVTSIGANAFKDCSGLTSVSIDITDLAAWCTNPLTSPFPASCTINLSVNGIIIKDLIIPEDVTTIVMKAFSGCSGLTSVSIPNSVTSIGYCAFQGCSGLTSAAIPNSVSIISDNAFNGCSGLTSINIPNSVTSIGKDAFKGCSSLTTVTLDNNTIVSTSHSSKSSLKDIFGEQVNIYVLGNNVTSIGNYAFASCKGLTEITIPNSVTSIEYDAFYGCSGLISATIPNSVTSIGANAFYGCSSATITLPDEITNIGSDAFKGVPTIYVIKGTKSMFTLWSNGYTPYETGTNKKLYCPSIDVSTTQTTATFKLNNSYPEYTYTLDSEELTSKGLVKTGLKPETDSYCFFHIYQDEEQLYSKSVSYTTASISPSLGVLNKTSSSISVKGSYIQGDAKVVSHKFKVNGVEYDGDEVFISGLDPNKAYDVTYKIEVAYGENGKFTATYSTDVNKGWNNVPLTISTASLTFTTLQPKVITPGNVIVAAESNLDDEETNVGFEWRRTDWTEDFASNSGVAYLFEGTMEGYIRNLYTEKLWKYRPYYESNSGTRYYGDWVGIDPTNTSYFEPTIHTYSTITISNDTAYIKGYALPGTDKTKVQGFKYWKTSQGSNASHQAPSVPSNAKTVEATGQQIITATLTALDYSSTYHYVAFVTTEEGTTYYGEERVFTTPKGNSIVKDDVNEDGVVDTQDVLAIYKYMQQSDGATAPGKYDVNGDGIVDTQDVLEIYKYIQEH